MTKQTTDLDRLAHGLDTWGADLARWPNPERAAAKVTLASSAEARRHMAKAQALDRVLARVPETTPPTAGLADRILAAALAERPAAGVPARAEADATVLALSRQKPAARIAPVATTTQAPATHVLSRARSGRWQAAAILVFALTTGVLIGAMDLVPGATGWIAELAGLETDAEQAVATIQFDGLPQMIDEEQL